MHTTLSGPYPSPNPSTHLLVYSYRNHKRFGPIIIMESYLGTDTFANWLKLILISNFLNAQVLLSVVSYAWETLTHRFYTTVEFDEFDSTFCERISPDLERMALTFCMLPSLDQYLARTATRMAHRPRHLHHNPLFRYRCGSFWAIRRVL